MGESLLKAYRAAQNTQERASADDANTASDRSEENSRPGPKVQRQHFQAASSPASSSASGSATQEVNNSSSSSSSCSDADNHSQGDDDHPDAARQGFSLQSSSGDEASQSSSSHATDHASGAAPRSESRADPASSSGPSSGESDRRRRSAQGTARGPTSEQTQAQQSAWRALQTGENRGSSHHGQPASTSGRSGRSGSQSRDAGPESSSEASQRSRTASSSSTGVLDRSQDQEQGQNLHRDGAAGSQSRDASGSPDMGNGSGRAADSQQAEASGNGQSRESEHSSNGVPHSSSSRQVPYEEQSGTVWSFQHCFGSDTIGKAMVSEFPQQAFTKLLSNRGSAMGSFHNEQVRLLAVCNSALVVAPLPNRSQQVTASLSEGPDSSVCVNMQRNCQFSFQMQCFWCLPGRHEESM